MARGPLWTEEEWQRALQLREEGCGVRDIALALKRTEPEIYARFRYMQVPISQLVRRPTARREAGQTTEERLRDIRIMIRQGKSFDYIREVFGWTADVLRTVCTANGVEIDGNAAPAPPQPKARATAEPAPVHVPAIRPPGERPRGYGRITSAQPRSVRVACVTTPMIAHEVARQAALRGMAEGALMHSLLAGAYKRGLWSDLLDSDSSFVASAFHPNQNNETQ